MAWYVEYLILYLCVVNVLGIVITAYDKIAAKNARWRISEKALMIFSAIGAGLSIYITMLIIRHKTKHPKFMIGIPVILAVECLISLGVYILVKVYG